MNHKVEYRILRICAPQAVFYWISLHLVIPVPEIIEISQGSFLQVKAKYGVCLKPLTFGCIVNSLVPPSYSITKDDKPLWLSL